MNRGVRIVHTLGGCQGFTVVNESGLYALIFKSRKPSARYFKNWMISGNRTFDCLKSRT